MSARTGIPHIRTLTPIGWKTPLPTSARKPLPVNCYRARRRRSSGPRWCRKRCKHRVLARADPGTRTSPSAEVIEYSTSSQVPTIRSRIDVAFVILLPPSYIREYLSRTSFIRRPNWIATPLCSSRLDMVCSPGRMTGRWLPRKLSTGWVTPPSTARGWLKPGTVHGMGRNWRRVIEAVR